MQVLVNLIYDSEYQGFVADVPQLPGCMSQGKTIEVALENIKEAISVFLEECGGKSRPSVGPTLTTMIEV